MAVVIDLVRHATSTWVEEADASPVKLFGGRMDEVPLSIPRGRQEALRLGCYGRANGIRPTLVVSSTAVRALETHEFSAPSLRISQRVTPDPRLVEMSWGRWTRQPRSIADTDRVRAARRRLGFDFAPPGGDSYNSVRDRALPAIMEHASRASNGSHIWVHTHRNVIKAIVRQWRPEWSPVSISEVGLDVVSLTRLRYHRGRLELVFFNRPTLTAA
ncbi:MAG TPA: histidine phosphatase family protein [Candidatus Saccharimonadales bacterium]|nr:histidine phosphatase family protein [Candidatus Saccharimonadales bacterium]